MFACTLRVLREATHQLVHVISLRDELLIQRRSVSLGATLCGHIAKNSEQRLDPTVCTGLGNDAAIEYALSGWCGNGELI